MEDKRNLTMGLQFSVADAIDDLTNILGYIQKIKGGFQDAEEEGDSFGSSLEKTTGDARKGLEGIGTEARNTAEMFGSVSHSGDEIKESILGARSAFNRMGVSAKENAADAGAGLDQASSAAGGVIRSLREISKVGNEAAAGYEQIGSQAKTAGILAEKGAKGSEEALTIADQEAKSLQESYKEIGDQAKTAGIRSEDGIGKAGTALNSVSNQAEKFADSIQTAGIRAEAAGEQAGKSAEDASNKLDQAKSAADRLKVSYRETGDAASSEMDKASQATEAATDSLEKVIPSGEKVKKAYREIGAAAESFGSAVVLSSREAMRETNSFGSTLKAGIEGAYGYAGKQADQFAKKARTGFQTIQTAIRHPVKTIKSEFVKALEDAGKKLDDVGDSADDAGDKARKAFQKAGTEIDDVGRKADRSENDLKDMGDSGESAGGRIKAAVGSAVTSFFAISAAIELFKAGIEVVKSFGAAILEAGTSAEKTGAQFDALFSGDSGVKEWADNFSSAVHRSNTEVKSFLASNKTMYQELGITGQAANDLSKITTSLAYDIGSAFKMEDAEALSLIQDYLKGNTEAFTAYGIQINEAALKQSAMAMGLGSNIEALDEASAAQVRMNALLENTTELQQAAAQKQTGYTNSIKSLKGVWTDFLTSAGSKFEPVFTSLSNTILTSWPQIEPALSGLIDMLSGGLSAGIPVITNLAVSSLPALVQTIGELAGAAAPMGGLFLDLATTALPPLANAVIPLISTFGTLAQTILPPLSRVISSIAQTVVPPLVEILQSLSENVIAPLMPHIESIANAILPALSAGLKLIPPILQTISPILEGIAGILSRVVGFLSKIVGWAAGGIGTVLNKVAGLFGGGGSSGGGDIPHNADGDPHFSGGWTHINERGGEVAYLPSGSTIIPADKSEQILSGGSQKSGPVSMDFSISVPIVINGDPDPGLIAELEERIKRTIRETVQEMQEEAAMNLAIQQGNA